MESSELRMSTRRMGSIERCFKVMYMYYLLSFKLLRRKQSGLNVSQQAARMDTEFIGFSEFLKNLSEDKKIAVGLAVKRAWDAHSICSGTKYLRSCLGW